MKFNLAQVAGKVPPLRTRSKTIPEMRITQAPQTLDE